MTSKLKLLVATSAVSVAMLGVNPAFAAGTSAGDAITNSVSVSYDVGGVTQTAETDSDTFTVDRKLDMTIVEANSAAEEVFPGQTAADTAGNPPAYLTFTVTNDSNDEVDFELSATQQTTGSATPFSGTDDFDVTGLQVFVDVNGNGTYEPATDTATFIDELGEDTSIAVFIVGNIPTSPTGGDAAGITLTADIKQGNNGTTGALGGDYTDDSGSANTENGALGGDPANIDNVFVQVTGSATDNFVIDTADISVVKTSSVLWDPISGNTNPKSIPGAVVEYCIAVTNSSTTVAATNVAITDDISALDVTHYDSLATGAGTPPSVDGVVSATACDGTGTNADASGLGHSSGTVSGNLGNIGTSSTETLIFRVTVD